jgi:hypothetical protein
LRHSQELVSLFSQRDSTEDDDGMEKIEATNIIINCVKSILAKPRIEVANGFNEFRKQLENESLEQDDLRCEKLEISPYFFRR